MVGNLSTRHFFWQRNYYDHVIRTQKSFNYIVNYINNNPLKWSEDRFFTL